MRWTDLAVRAALVAMTMLAGVECRSQSAARNEAVPSTTTLAAPLPAAAAPSRSPSPAPVAVPSGPPSEQAPLAAIRAFVEAHPDHTLAPRLRQVHDRRLLPCPRGWKRCEPHALIVAQGALDRARAYPKRCLDCRDRAAVLRLETRLDAVVRDLETRDARARFDAAMGRDLIEAEQVLADSTTAYANWRAHAERRLDRRRRQLGGTPLELDPSCRVPPGMAALVSPERPTTGNPLRVLLTSRETNPTGTFTLEREGGERVDWEMRSATDEGPPSFWLGTVQSLAAGRYRAVLRRGNEVIACQRLRVRESPEVHPDRSTGAWTTRRGWSGATEDLYSAWLRLLVDAPEAKHWHGLFELTRDPRRNVLVNHLGLDEDTPRGLVSYELEPDCADGPYFLRSYFAYKLGLPFGWHECRYEPGMGSPKCGNWTTNETWKPETASGAEQRDSADDGQPPRADATASTPEQIRRSRLERMNELLRDVKEAVMARSLRTRLDDDATDLYPVALSREGLRPGAVFADPYGHTLTLVRWVPQRSESPGKLLSVDAQPDGTLAVKRFWRGNFVFRDQRGLGGHGFKAFRPIVLVDGKARLLGNHDLAVARGYGTTSLEQMGLPPRQFYARVQRLINPDPIDPVAEYRALHEALLELLHSRVQSIAIAEEYKADSRGKPIPMPAGRAIFSTTGPWEAYSTPCRDLRLLVGIDYLLAYPAEAATTSSGGRDVVLEERLRSLHRDWARELTFEYARSDGSRQQLSIADVVVRRKALETAYNPNDCPEIRWGASPGSAERSTCTTRAPDAQQRRMESMRHWFVKRYACG